MSKNTDKAKLIHDKLIALGSSSYRVASTLQKIGSLGVKRDDGSAMFHPLLNYIEEIANLEIARVDFYQKTTVSFGTYSAGTFTEIELPLPVIQFCADLKNGKYQYLWGSKEYYSTRSRKRYDKLFGPSPYKPKA